MGSKSLTVLIFTIIISLILLISASCTGAEELTPVREEVTEEEPEMEEAEEEPGDKSADPETAEPITLGGTTIDGVIEEGEYSGNTFNEATGIDLYYSIDDMYLYVGVKSSDSGWTAIGFDPESAMKGADIIFMSIESGELVMRDDFGTGTFSHSSDVDLGGSFDIVESAVSTAGGEAIYEFSKPLDSGDEFDKVMVPGNVYKVIFSVNDSSSDFDRKHTFRSSDELQF